MICFADACKNVECLNEGACLEGQCRCAKGFSGEKCEINDGELIHIKNDTYHPFFSMFGAQEGL